MSSDRGFAPADGSLAPSVLILGAGYCGTALASRLQDSGAAVPAPAPGSWRVGARIPTPSPPFDVVWLVPPTTAAAVASHLDTLLERGARRAVYISSTTVYGAGDGLVDGQSPRRPTTARGSARVTEEDEFLCRGGVVVRLPGIYGPGRSILDRLRAGYTLVNGGEKWSARVHRDDVAMGVEVVLRQGQGPYVLTDGTPFQVRELVEFACALLVRDLPPSESLASYRARRGEFAASFWAHSNRYDTSAIASLPGFALKYPSWRDGLQDLFAGASSNDVAGRT
jgi:nucleoside-diphosphate-sugar epimerase